MHLTRAQIRDLDRRAIEEYGVPALVLMENAGRGAADVLWSLGVTGPIAICCGKGNNGGDGLVMARHLDNRGAKVVVHLFVDPAYLSPEAAVHWNIVKKTGLTTRVWDYVDAGAIANELRQADWIVEAMFGTGLGGPVRPPFDRVVATINVAGAKVFAVDIPAGLDADTGEALGPTVRADHTATFVASKKGYANPAASAWLGHVHVIDIGVPRKLLEETQAAG